MWKRHGKLAHQLLGVRLELMVLQSAAGFYLGTVDDEGPVSRESQEYWPSREAAERALADSSLWSQVECLEL